MLQHLKNHYHLLLLSFFALDHVVSLIADTLDNGSPFFRQGVNELLKVGCVEIELNPCKSWIQADLRLLVFLFWIGDIWLLVNNHAEGLLYLSAVPFVLYSH